jgi:hypothetical protein
LPNALFFFKKPERHRTGFSSGYPQNPIRPDYIQAGEHFSVFFGNLTVT